MLKKSLCVFVLAGMCAAQAQAGTIITAVERRNSANGAPELVTPLEVGTKVFVDRDYTYATVPEALVGADYVRAANSDKTVATVEYEITLGVPAKVYLILDARVGDDNAGNPPDPSKNMKWVLDLGFQSTGMTMGFGGDMFYVYEATFRRGKVTFLAQNEGSTRNMYCIAAVAGPPADTASGPVPEDGATDMLRDVAMSWTPGELAATHDVYLGTDFDDVNTATAASPLLVSAGQEATSYAPPALLDFGKTYYWRIDEVNGAPDFKVYKGDVWSFTIEPYAYPITKIEASASSSSNANTGPGKTIDSSGLDAGDLHGTVDTTMWLTKATAPQPAWIQYQFDRVYKLQKMWVWNYNQSLEPFAGLGAKDVTIEYATDANDWQVLAGVPEFTRAPGTASYAHDTTIDFGGVAASKVRLTINSNWGGLIPQTGLSEVRFYYVPVQAREPQPATEAVAVQPDVTLSWRSGREAASHEVYVSTDPNAVADGTVVPGVSSVNSYAPADLNLGMTYSWKVNEVNTAEAISTWESDIWSFTVADYRTIDGFEGYTNESPNRVFQTWIDGLGFSTDDFFPANSGNGTDAMVGYDPQFGDIMEKAIVRAPGKQSMPLYYGPGVSEITRTFDSTQDWTKYGIKTLVLYFYGNASNTAGELYVKINSTKILYGGDASDVARRRWNQWNVDLTAVQASALRSVRTLTIGLSGGEGELLLDDIRLYRVAPEVPAAVDPGTAGLVASYAMTNNVQDGSGKGNHGTLVGAPVYVDGQVGFGKALQFNGITDCVDLGNKPMFNFAGSFSLSVWANITTWTNNWGHTMVGNRGESNMGWQLRRRDSNKICFTTRGVGNDDLGSNMNAPLDEWIHIAAVYDNANNTKRIYVNGVEDIVGNTNAGATLAATTHNTYIGARANGDNTGREAFFGGMLDDIRIYDRVLSAGEIEFLADPTP